MDDSLYFNNDHLVVREMVRQFAREEVAPIAASCASEIALRDGRNAWSWAQTDDKLNRVANALYAVDLGPDRRIAVFAENGAEVVLAHIGGLVAGCSTVPFKREMGEPNWRFAVQGTDHTETAADP